MLRVAQVVPVANHSPWFADICAEVRRRGFDVVSIIGATEGNLSERLTREGIRHYRVPMYFASNLDRARLFFYLFQLPIAVFKVARILRREKIDVAQSHIFVANLVTRLACFFTRTRHISTAAGPRHLEAPLTRAVDRLTWSLDEAIVGGCEYTAQLYRDAGAKGVECIYYGPPAERFDPKRVDKTSFRRELGIADDVPVVGLVAHFYPPTRGPQTPVAARGIGLKGHDVFLAAARIAAKRFPRAKFVLVGSGSNALGEEYRQSLIDACRADGFIDHVIFPGHRYDIAEALASFDVAVQCAWTEGLGGCLEALLMERPVIATNVGGMPEAVRHEETGLLVPPGDADALACAIERLLENREEALHLGRAGRALVLQRFTLARTGADLTALYAKVADSCILRPKVFPQSISLAGTDIGEDERLLVEEVLRSGRLSNGPMLERLEHDFAERCGAKHAIGVSSGTAALHLSLLAAGVRDGDIVITTPFSFIASANPILYERAIPAFIDIDPHTLTIDPAAAIEAMEAIVFRRRGWEHLLPVPSQGKLRAIIPVDIFGRTAEMRDLVHSARAMGVAVIEDACEAVGGSLDGVPAGRWGDAGTFAFYPNKQMTTGEGGLVLTDNDAWARLIRSLRSQGRSDDGSWLRHERIGYNYRLNDLSAAVGVAQLRRLDELLQKRENVAAMYTERLASIEGVAPLPPPRAGMVISWFIYVVRVEDGVDRDTLADRLATRGIPTRPYFWPIHLQPPYQQRFGYKRGMYPHSEAAGDSLLALPFHGRMTEAQVDFVCACVAEEARHARGAAGSQVG